MEADEAEPQFRALVKEWGRQSATAEKAAQQARALDKVIRGYIEMFPSFEKVFEEVNFLPLEPGSADDDGSPKGAEAVRVILQERSGEPLWVSELVTGLRERGWLPDSPNPANAVRTAAERLVADQDSDVIKHRYRGKVTYTYDPDRDRTPSNGGYDENEEPF